MTRLRTMGLSLVFAMMLAVGMLLSTPTQAQAETWGPRICAQLSTSITYLTNLANRYPNSRLIAYLLAEFTQAYNEHCR